MVEILRCPACGAADTSKAGPDGAHACVFCGVRYVVRAGVPQTASVAAPVAAPKGPVKRLPSMTLVAVAVVIVFVCAGFAAGVYAAMAPAPTTSYTPPEPVFEAPIVVSTPVVSASPVPAAEAPATATFVEHNIRPAGDSYWILGVVTNTSPYPIQQPRFDLLYLDEAGNEVGVGTSYGQSDPLAPGASMPVSLLASKPPKHASHRVEPTVEKLTYDMGMITTFDHKEYAPTRGTFDWELSGAVTNTNDVPVRFIQVVVAAWDKADKLIGVNYTYAAGEQPLAPGATGRYSVSVDTLDTEPARFTRQVTGRK